MRAQKVIVAVSLEEETRKTLSQIGLLNFSMDTEVHLVHVVPIILYSRGIHPQALTYPLKEERPRIEDAILVKLNQIKEIILPHHHNVVLKCLFDGNEKEAFCHYAFKQAADLTIVATRKKHGVLSIFDSSFAEYQLRHSEINLLVLR